MKNQDTQDTKNQDTQNTKIENIYSTDDVLEFLWKMLSSRDLPENLDIINYYKEDPTFKNILNFVFDLRELSGSLSKGQLDKLVYSKGYVLSNLKALQSNLRHLTWQTKKIAEGDFSQKVDFLGDFSQSFNEMSNKLEIYSKKLKMLAHFDQLTQIPNRYFFIQFLSKFFDKFLRDHEVFSIMMFDIDYFKKINDTYGHDIGDIVLVQLANTIKSRFRASDVFARYGGEEFIAVLLNTGANDAFTVAERMLESVRDLIIYVSESIKIKITVSIGISQADIKDGDFNSIIKRSDEALYMAKRNGRNQIAVI